jgi:hypothetical protein
MGSHAYRTISGFLEEWRVLGPAKLRMRCGCLGGRCATPAAKGSIALMTTEFGGYMLLDASSGGAMCGGGMPMNFNASLDDIEKYLTGG